MVRCGDNGQGTLRGSRMNESVQPLGWKVGEPSRKYYRPERLETLRPQRDGP